ncbi:MAG: hypothetical protein COW52_11255, partial [Nitrospirae bacterium CG17_big_fil_post_rev_8_21_14_2_50_50_9]
MDKSASIFYDHPAIKKKRQRPFFLDIWRSLVSDLTPLMRQYTQIKSRYKDSILFFRMGDFYEMFNEDAKVASRALQIALTKRGKSEGMDIPLCGVPFHAAEPYIAKLIRQGFKVAVCEQ